MKNFDIIKRSLEIMKSDTLYNYIVAGLDSSLIAANSNKGCVRYFECSREHQDTITPHTHRFNFSCLVLDGVVANTIWVPSGSHHDLFMISTLNYKGEPGAYEKIENFVEYFKPETTLYSTGDCYRMDHEEFHSIKFSRDARVLFFEEPIVTNSSQVLEPVVRGKVIPTLETKPYMFLKD